MTKEFEMIGIRLMSYYLDVEVKQRKDGIFITQEGYARDILNQFEMDDCKAINTPMECVIKLSKYDGEEKVDPTLFKSLVGSLRCLTCTRPNILYATGSDSDWAGDNDDQKSTSGFVFFMGDTIFTWMSKKQPIVTLSTCEAEYVAPRQVFAMMSSS